MMLRYPTKFSPVFQFPSPVSPNTGDHSVVIVELVDLQFTPFNFIVGFIWVVIINIRFVHLGCVDALELPVGIGNRTLSRSLTFVEERSTSIGSGRLNWRCWVWNGVILLCCCTWNGSFNLGLKFGLIRAGSNLPC